MTAALFLAGISETLAQGSGSVARPPGRIVVAAVTGDVTVRSGDNPQNAIPLRKGVLISRDQTIFTGKDSRVVLVFSNGATVNLSEKSVLQIDEFLQEPLTEAVKVSTLSDEPTTSTTKLNLVRGELLSNVKHLRIDKGSEFKIETPVGAAGIRGTTFALMFRPDGRKASFALRMLEGLIRLSFANSRRELDVGKGKQVLLNDIEIDASGKVISLPSTIQPSDVPTSSEAAMAASLQEIIQAQSDTTFDANAPATSPSNPGTPSGTPPTPETAAPAPDTVSPLSPAPQAVEPPARVTPADGA
jgi:hypothetical protein